MKENPQKPNPKTAEYNLGNQQSGQ